MRRLVLDAGPLIALLSSQDNYHKEAREGFAQLPKEFGEVLTPLPILFEVYKFVAREQSPSVARKALSVIKQETVIILLEIESMQTIFDLAMQMTNWQGSLEDASVVVIAQKFNAPIWTIDYRDLSWFKNIQLWTPFT